ncbi:MAG: beta-galactosidase [Thermoguttaceae bacterium]|nr:beta-galactosidase [Thermoguttaceae bacterium]
MRNHIFIPAAAALLISGFSPFGCETASISAAAPENFTKNEIQKNEVTIFSPASNTAFHLNAAELTKAPDLSYFEFDAHGKNYQWPGPVWTGNWNLEGCSKILIEMENLSTKEISFCVRIDDPAAKQNNANWFTQNIKVPAQTRGVFSVELPASFPKQLQGKIVGMRGLPGGSRLGAASLDWRNVVSFFIFVGEQNRGTKFRVYSIKAIKGEKQTPTAEWMKMAPEEFFPMIDRYGQFKYEDWPGKIHSDAEFAERIKAEKADIAANPRPGNWDKYGGWSDGPKLKATGRFRVEKVGGNWWLVTPEGHLFWSHGTDCVGMSNGNGPISEREHYFEDLPKDSPFYGKGWTHIGFYGGKGEFRTFNWTKANLERKYGPDFAARHSESAHERLASWGMNTIGNWSSGEIFKMQKTPYVVTLSAGGRAIEGSEGYWGKFPDPFTDEFRVSIRNSVKWNQEALNSPYCVGAFVNNELSWGGQYSLARAALASPADQPAKIEFVNFLQKKYGTVEKLNQAWKTAYADWNAILNSAVVPKDPALNPDLDAFYSVIAEKYFAVIHEELRAGAPETLDLGCRFAWTCDSAAYAMAKYVDVMSYNRYEEHLENFKLPQGIDMPVIIGEFHFGALDRGVFHTGLRGAKDQNERAEKYYGYVRSALENPAIVGTHWFQYGAQPTTGRFDGENYQIGLVDIGDTPYPEIIAKVREIGRTMYQIRANSKK